MSDDTQTLTAQAAAFTQARRWDDAVGVYRRLLERSPDDARVYCDLGRALNNLRRLEDAQRCFEKAVELEPGSAPAHNFVGHVRRARGQIAAAAEAFVAALEIEPDFLGARRNLGVTRMLEEAPALALEHFEICTRLAPQQPGSWLDLGLCQHTLGRFDAARDAYERAIELAPDLADAHRHLALVHTELRDTGRAEQALNKALALAPRDPDIRADLAALYEETNRLDEAQAAAASGLAFAPDAPRLRLEAAKCARRAGEVDKALAWLAPVDLTRVEPRLAQLAHFELGTLYDRAKQTDDAWRHFSAGNALAARSARMANVVPERYVTKLDALNAFFSSADVGSFSAVPPERDEPPVFLIGFPRSGTMLCDLVLDGHPRIQCVEERPTITAMEDLLAREPGGYPAALAALDAATVERLRLVYAQTVMASIERAPDRRLVDKMPIRTAHAGLIGRVFPSAPIVFAARHPCDVVLSGWMQQYALNDAFANFFTLEQSVAIYARVMRLWQLYTERLPLRYHVVRYEDLIGDLETTARGLLSFLDLPWHSGVLDHRSAMRARGRINTNFYHQVADPIYTRARYRWLRYRKYLEPFFGVLAPHAERFGYSLD